MRSWPPSHTACARGRIVFRPRIGFSEAISDRIRLMSRRRGRSNLYSHSATFARGILFEIARRNSFVSFVPSWQICFLLPPAQVVDLSRELVHAVFLDRQRRNEQLLVCGNYRFVAVDHLVHVDDRQAAK